MSGESGEPRPDALQSDAGGVPSEFLIFLCVGQTYAVDIMSVKEIRSWSAPTPLPHAPRSMIGMLNLRGTVLPVIDLALRLGLPPTEADPRHVIIIVQHGDAAHGLLVEAVSDIVHQPPDTMQDVPSLSGEGDPFAQALFTLDDDVVQVLCLDSLLPMVTAGEPAVA